MATSKIIASKNNFLDKIFKDFKKSFVVLFFDSLPTIISFKEFLDLYIFLILFFDNEIIFFSLSIGL